MAEDPEETLTFLFSYTVDYIQYNLDLLGEADVNARQLLHDFGGLKFLVEACSDIENSSELANASRNMVSQTEDLAEKYIVYLFQLKRRPLAQRILNAVRSSETHQVVGNECRRLSEQIEILKKRFSDMRSAKRLTMIPLTKSKHKAWVEVSEPGDQNYENKNIEIIRNCFSMLSDSLKQCFLYVGIFPKDSISTRKLLRLWIAEGYVHGRGNLEDRAQRYLNELMDRNLVIVANKRWNGEIKQCRVHDLARKFCKEEAMRQTVFRELKGMSPVNTGQPFDGIAIYSEIQNYVTSAPSNESVRSFLSFPKEEDELPTKHFSSIPKIFKWLRVLDVRSVNLRTLPSEFYYLILLRYIAICCNIDNLSEKLSKLWNLQTLIIETLSPTLEIRAKIWTMKQLRHLQTNSSARLLKPYSASLLASTLTESNVQTLSTIDPQSCTKDFFETFRNLKKLGIRGKLAPFFKSRNGSNFFKHLSTLEFLEDLKLLNDKQGGELRSLPGGMQFPSKLNRLTLFNTSLDWKYMSTIGKLENLQELKLKENAFVGDIWTTEDWGFASLIVLFIQNVSLVQFNASGAHFPQLKTLILKRCYKLNDVPCSFANVVTIS